MHLVINIDGGSRGNPGPAAAGVVIRTADDATVLHAAGIYLGNTTNNVAEYQGLLEGLKKAAELGATNVEVISDSELLVRQMNGQYRVKNAGLLPLFEKAKALTHKFALCKITHVRREFNKAADGLVNKALNQKQSVVE